MPANSYHNYFDIYGNERQGTWKKLIKHLTDVPEDSGLSYPDTSWWADPNLITGGQYDLLMMWLTEPTVFSQYNMGYANPIARISALRGISVEYSRTISVPIISDKNVKELQNVIDIYHEYEPKIWGDDFISYNDLKGNIVKVKGVGSIFNSDRPKRLTPFRFRLPSSKVGMTRRIVWADLWSGGKMKGKNRKWVEVPAQLYQCLTVEDRTLNDIDLLYRKVNATLIPNYADHLPTLEEIEESLVENYEEIIQLREEKDKEK